MSVTAARTALARPPSHGVPAEGGLRGLNRVLEVTSRGETALRFEAVLQRFPNDVRDSDHGACHYLDESIDGVNAVPPRIFPDTDVRRHRLGLAARYAETCGCICCHPTIPHAF